MNSKNYFSLIRLFCLLITLFLYPNLGFAQTGFGEPINVSSDDLSVRFLSNIFGVVDGVLHGSGSQIFGAMFGVFNAGILTLGMTILGYTLFVSTLRTAHEGEVLGRNWSSIWIPFKSAAGFALILPKASGYCIIQILVMWTVVQGVGAANLVWNAALDYLQSGGTIVQPNQPSRQGSVALAGDILRAETCMFMLQEALNEEQQSQKTNTTSGGAGIPSFFQSVANPTAQTQPEYVNDKKPILYFPGKLYNADGSPYANQNFYKACGSVTWEASGTNLNDAATQQLADARALAVTQVIMDLQPYAQQIAADYGPFPNAKRAALSSNLKGQTILLDAGNDYEGIISPAINSMKNYRSDLGYLKFIEEAKKKGWIMAGTYYQQLVNLNQNYVTEVSTYPTVNFAFPADNDNLPTSIKSNAKALQAFFGPSSPPSVALSSGATSPLLIYIQAQGAQAKANVSQGDVVAASFGKFMSNQSPGGSALGQITSVFTLGISSIISGYYSLISQTGEPGSNLLNPVTAAATVGSGLVTLVTSIWFMGAVTVFGFTALASICPAANPLPTAITSAMAWFVPLLTALLISMFLMGATLAYYVPLIPYILFLFGGLGWIIGVIESIAAAPIVAIGIAYPEEHEILGKAQPAVMLLTNIFIRPSLMVIGFIAGISLSYVGIWLLNLGFKNALVSLTVGAQGLAWLVMPIAILAIYTLLVVQVLNQAFGLIHVLPDEVLRWISGAPNKQFGEGKGEEAVARGFKEEMGHAGRAMGESTGRAQEAKEQKVQAEKALQLGQTDGGPGGGDGGGPGVAPGGGGGGGGGGNPPPGGGGG